MMTSVQHKLAKWHTNSNEDYCTATMSVYPYNHTINGTIPDKQNGCIFKVGDEIYFVPTRQVAEDDMLYITCDAQKIEGRLDGCHAQLALGDSADHAVEDAILNHLYSAPGNQRRGEAFVITRDGKTFRL